MNKTYIGAGYKNFAPVFCLMELEMKMKKETELWLELCERDMKGAHGMYETKNYVLAGYQCHQVAEKALKAYITTVSSGKPPYIHNLLRLLGIAGLESDMPEEMVKLLDCLEPLNIEARYSGYKSAILSRLTSEYIRDLISKTEELLSWIQNRLLK